MGVAVRITLFAIEHLFPAKRVEDILGDAHYVPTGQPVESIDVDAVFIDGRDDRKVVLAAESEVLRATARRDMDDSGSLVGANFVPQHNPMGIARLGEGFANARQIIERAGVFPAGHRISR